MRTWITRVVVLGLAAVPTSVWAQYPPGYYPTQPPVYQPVPTYSKSPATYGLYPDVIIETPQSTKRRPEQAPVVVASPRPVAPTAPPLTSTNIILTQATAKPSNTTTVPATPKTAPVITTTTPDSLPVTKTTERLELPPAKVTPEKEAVPVNNKRSVLGAYLSTNGSEATQSEPASSTSSSAETCVGPNCDGHGRRGRMVGFIDYLYWNVHGVDVPYAQAFDGVIPVLAAPRGQVAVASPKYNSGFRVGGGFVSGDNDCGLYGTFTYFRTDRSDQTTAPDPFVLQNFLAFPNTATAAVDSLTASIDYRILLMMADIDFKAALVNRERLILNMLAGGRFAHLDQNLEATYLITGTTTVTSDIEFDGFGPRFGLDGQYQICGGFYGYGQSVVNVLFGQFRANAEQQNVFTGLIGSTGITANRVVPILELEIGAGWQSPGGAFRVSGGYYVGAWFNTMTMTSLSNGIGGTNFTTNSDNFRDTMTFDGLVLRFELRY